MHYFPDTHYLHSNHGCYFLSFLFSVLSFLACFLFHLLFFFICSFHSHYLTLSCWILLPNQLVSLSCIFLVSSHFFPPLSFELCGGSVVTQPQVGSENHMFNNCRIICSAWSEFNKNEFLSHRIPCLAWVVRP